MRDLIAPGSAPASGQLRLCELTAQPLPIGGDACLLTIARDITEREQMQEKLQQAATVFESTAEGVLITDLEQHITAVNRAFTAHHRLQRERSARPATPACSPRGQHDNAFYAAMWTTWLSERPLAGRDLEPAQERRAVPGMADHQRGAQRRAARSPTSSAVFADITPLKHAQARLDYQAHHDPLTGLPNRLLFENRLQMALDGQALNEQRRGAVLFLDLDRFKHINDTLGHPVGDLLLKAIARAPARTAARSRHRGAPGRRRIHRADAQRRTASRTPSRSPTS